MTLSSPAVASLKKCNMAPHCSCTSANMTLTTMKGYSVYTHESTTLVVCTHSLSPTLQAIAHRPKHRPSNPLRANACRELLCLVCFRTTSSTSTLEKILDT